MCWCCCCAIREKKQKKSDESMNGPMGTYEWIWIKVSLWIWPLCWFTSFSYYFFPSSPSTPGEIVFLFVMVNGGVLFDRMLAVPYTYTFIAFDDNINFAFHSIRCAGFVSLFIWYRFLCKSFALCMCAARPPIMFDLCMPNFLSSSLDFSFFLFRCTSVRPLRPTICKSFSVAFTHTQFG